MKGIKFYSNSIAVICIDIDVTNNLKQIRNDIINEINQVDNIKVESVDWMTVDILTITLTYNKDKIMIIKEQFKKLGYNIKGDIMAKKYKTAKSIIKENIDCLHIFESLVENCELADTDLHIIEDKLKPIYESDEIKKEINNEIADIILKILEKHNINIGYEYIEFDADELYNYIKDWHGNEIKKGDIYIKSWENIII